MGVRAQKLRVPFQRYDSPALQREEQHGFFFFQSENKQAPCFSFYFAAFQKGAEVVDRDSGSTRPTLYPPPPHKGCAAPLLAAVYGDGWRQRSTLAFGCCEVVLFSSRPCYWLDKTFSLPHPSASQVTSQDVTPTLGNITPLHPRPRQRRQ